MNCSVFQLCTRIAPCICINMEDLVFYMLPWTMLITNWWHLQVLWTVRSGSEVWAECYWALSTGLSTELNCLLCIYSSIHDHTDSHCFLKMLQGNLKETLFAWPDKKSNEMIKKSERTLRENQCAYINGNMEYHFLRASGKSLELPFEILLAYLYVQQNLVHGVMISDTWKMI